MNEIGAAVKAAEAALEAERAEHANLRAGAELALDATRKLLAATRRRETRILGQAQEWRDRAEKAEAALAQAQEAALEQLEHARRDARIFALEEAAQTCEKQQNVSLSGGVCRTLDERFVCGVCAAAIRALKREP